MPKWSLLDLGALSRMVVVYVNSRVKGEVFTMPSGSTPVFSFLFYVDEILLMYSEKFLKIFSFFMRLSFCLHVFETKV